MDNINNELLRQLVSSQIELTIALKDQVRAIDSLVTLIDSQNAALHNEQEDEDEYMTVKDISGNETRIKRK